MWVGKCIGLMWQGLGSGGAARRTLSEESRSCLMLDQIQLQKAWKREMSQCVMLVVLYETIFQKRKKHCAVAPWKEEWEYVVRTSPADTKVRVGEQEVLQAPQLLCGQWRGPWWSRLFPCWPWRMLQWNRWIWDEGGCSSRRAPPAGTGS